MLREIESRPLVLLLAALVIGLTAVVHPLNLALLVPALVLFRNIRTWSILAAGLAVGLILAPQPKPLVTQPIYTEGIAKIVSIPHEVAGKEFAQAEVSNLRVQLRCPAFMNVHFRDEWQIKGVVRPLGEIAAQTLVPEGLQGTLTVDNGTRCQTGPAIFAWADQLRRSFSAFTAASIPEDEAAWLDRLCFRTGSLSPQDQAEIDEAGAGYLIAASGLQVYILAGLLMGALTALRVPRTLTIAIAMTCLCAYCLSTGAHLSTVRAVLACGLFAVAYLFRREPDMLSALALAATGFLLVSPQAVYSLGFSLTTVVIAALALFMPRPSRNESGQKPLAKQALTAAAIVIVAGQPLMALYSGRFSLGAIPANLLSGIAAPVAVALSFLGYAASFVSQTLGAGLLNMAAPLTEYLRTVTHWVGTAGLGFDVPAFGGWWLVAYYALWLLAWRPRAALA